MVDWGVGGEVGGGGLVRCGRKDGRVVEVVVICCEGI